MLVPRMMKRLKEGAFVEFHSTFSRHAKVQTSLALVTWLNENVQKYKKK